VVAAVYIADFLTVQPDIEREVLRGVATVSALNKTKEADLFPQIADASALIVWHKCRLTAETFKRLPNCKIIVRCGSGFDTVDVEAAGYYGIAVSNTPDFGVDEVADHAIALALGLTRKIYIYVDALMQRGSAEWSALPGDPRYRNSGRRFGIVGLGHIGLATALRAKACGWEVVFHDPYARAGIEKSVHVQRVEFDELIATSDVISLHTPLNKQTRHLINATVLAKMKPTAVLVNTSRGSVVDQAALLAALREGSIAGAGLDVLEKEPPGDDDPLFAAWRSGQLANVIITPHCAAGSVEAFNEMRRKPAEEVRRVLQGGEPRTLVNQQYLRPKGV
jgi:D-3-phosphoglycerate dehydrogenase/C-terminal binding protein